MASSMLEASRRRRHRDPLGVKLPPKGFHVVKDDDPDALLRAVPRLVQFGARDAHPATARHPIVTHRDRLHAEVRQLRTDETTLHISVGLDDFSDDDQADHIRTHLPECAHPVLAPPHRAGGTRPPRPSRRASAVLPALAAAPVAPARRGSVADAVRRPAASAARRASVIAPIDPGDGTGTGRPLARTTITGSRSTSRSGGLVTASRSALSRVAAAPGGRSAKGSAVVPAGMAGPAHAAAVATKLAALVKSGAAVDGGDADDERPRNAGNASDLSRKYRDLVKPREKVSEEAAAAAPSVAESTQLGKEYVKSVVDAFEDYLRHVPSLDPDEPTSQDAAASNAAGARATTPTVPTAPDPANLTAPPETASADSLAAPGDPTPSTPSKPATPTPCTPRSPPTAGPSPLLATVLSQLYPSTGPADRGDDAAKPATLYVQPELDPPQDLLEYIEHELGIPLDLYCPAGWVGMHPMPAHMVAATVAARRHRMAAAQAKAARRARGERRASSIPPEMVPAATTAAAPHVSPHAGDLIPAWARRGSSASSGSRRPSATSSVTALSPDPAGGASSPARARSPSPTLQVPDIRVAPSDDDKSDAEGSTTEEPHQVVTPVPVVRRRTSRARSVLVVPDSPRPSPRIVLRRKRVAVRVPGAPARHLRDMDIAMNDEPTAPTSPSRATPRASNTATSPWYRPPREWFSPARKSSSSSRTPVTPTATSTADRSAVSKRLAQLTDRSRLEYAQLEAKYRLADEPGGGATAEADGAETPAHLARRKLSAAVHVIGMMVAAHSTGGGSGSGSSAAAAAAAGGGGGGLQAPPASAGMLGRRGTGVPGGVGGVGG
ncbi:hypothetical protein AMAG_17091 [Allomyces macrogynus ATCC 38327]|uniref:Uncharacterized protein n=1 Tax=Allomyces macrogynus (strain ATCC 38327) TaxID=578462 RepID=A0A0L0TCW5_ALLM3|nr:hypothetical protein AMAG_17091 [Allomyces macrogynus ATCC 38327]|eukprot:KNE72763.1 hypothetical protein AMAG_17091 [Allomyces macrogynus ATCC 38327]